MKYEILSHVLLYLIRIADKFDIDLEDAILEKLQLNADKYPVELSKDDNNDSGIIINVDDAEESADFVYPRMYTSTLNVVIK